MNLAALYWLFQSQHLCLEIILTALNPVTWIFHLQKWCTKFNYRYVNTHIHEKLLLKAAKSSVTLNTHFEISAYALRHIWMYAMLKCCEECVLRGHSLNNVWDVCYKPVYAFADRVSPLVRIIYGCLTLLPF